MLYVPTPLKPDTIVAEVAQTYGVTVGEILSCTRMARISGARHVAMYLVRRFCQLSYPDIARLFNRKNHATVMYACAQVEKDCAGSRHVQRTVDELVQALEARAARMS